MSPLNEFLTSKNTLWQEYDIDDFYNSAFSTGIKNGKIYTIPILLETSLLAYNKEKFLNNLMLQYQKQWMNLKKRQKKIYKESDGKIYGITMRGKSPSSTSQWADFLHSFGGELAG